MLIFDFGLYVGCLHDDFKLQLMEPVQWRSAEVDVVFVCTFKVSGGWISGRTFVLCRGEPVDTGQLESNQKSSA
jgi:hypothetical protein